MSDYHVGIYGGQNVVSACYSTYPLYNRCQAGAWGNKEFSPIDVRQWLIAGNRQALNDGKIRISNIEINTQGYAFWRGNNVDLCSAPTVQNMWGDSSPTPTPPAPTPPTPSDTKMPIWFYLKIM